MAVRHATEAYLASLGPGPHDVVEVATRVTDLANAAVHTYNSATGARIASLANPTVSQVATCLVRLHDVVRIDEPGTASDFAQLAVYMTAGPMAGTYSTDESDIRRLARLYRQGMTRAMVADLVQELMDQTPSVAVCSDRDLVAVENGVFDYRTKELRPFDKSVVLLSKSPIPFVRDAPSPTIHNDEDGTDWTLDQCVEELALVPGADGLPDQVDPEVVEVLWQIVGACVRPLVHWNKAAFLYSTTGNNGKGTFCRLLRGVVGHSATNIPLVDLGKEFHLESLSNRSAIIADENDVGVFLDRVANLKALITKDVVLVNRKGKVPVALRWRGFMVQCLNGLPESRDKSQSFYRRQLFVPFRNRFEGRERKYVKEEYLERRDVLEYALSKTLTMPDYYELVTPSASRSLMAQYQLANDNVREFWLEVSGRSGHDADGNPRPEEGRELVWDVVPNAFLYDLYTAWMSRTNPSGKPIGRNRFLMSLRELVGEEATGWKAPVGTNGVPATLRVTCEMNAPERLIDVYDLRGWMDPTYSGIDWRKRCRPPRPAGDYFVRGIVRDS